MKFKSKKPERSSLRKWERIVSIAADAGSIVMSLRDKPTKLDWLAMGVRALGLAKDVRDEHRSAHAKSPWRFFESDGAHAEWREVPDTFAKLLLEHVREVDIVDDYWDGDPTGDMVCLGKLDDEIVGWVLQAGEDVVDGPYLRADRYRETLSALGRRVWAKVGSEQIVLRPDGFAIDEFDDRGLLPSQQFRDLTDRLRAFSNANVRRSFLFVGPPGTGKSVGVRYLARKLGLRSARVDLRAFASSAGTVSLHFADGLDTMLQLLLPDVMILDDLDRVETTGRLLHFLESALQSCRFVLASANRPENMGAAVLRPGRFDEIITVDRLDPEVVRRMLGDEDAALVKRLKGMPAAYIADYIKRREVLGAERAHAELVDIERRYKAQCKRDD